MTELLYTQIQNEVSEALRLLSYTKRHQIYMEWLDWFEYDEDDVLNLDLKDADDLAKVLCNADPIFVDGGVLSFLFEHKLISDKGA